MDWGANPKEAKRFTGDYETAWSLIKGLILIHGNEATGPPGWLAKRRLKRALTLFNRALEIHPGSWQSLWGVGKIYQRLGVPEKALQAFAAAHKLEPEQADVAREAGLAALELGAAGAAIRFTHAAIAVADDDAGLVSNLALAYLLDGKPEAALRHAEDALGREPSDVITITLHIIIKEVLAGERSCPTSMAELNESL